MDVGVAIPTCKEGLSSPVGFARPEQVIEVIVRAEALGYHSVWGNDHITAPQYVREHYAEPAELLRATGRAGRRRRGHPPHPAGDGDDRPPAARAGLPRQAGRHARPLLRAGA